MKDSDKRIFEPADDLIADVSILTSEKSSNTDLKLETERQKQVIEVINKLLDITDHQVLAASIRKICFTEVSENDQSLEGKLHSVLKEHFLNDERLEFVNTVVEGIPLEFVIVKALTNVVDFVTPIIPFIRKNPETTYIGFHDTSLYRCRSFETEGLTNPGFTDNGFYLHAQYLFKDKNWTSHFLDRLSVYGRQFNDPFERKWASERAKKYYPPEEIVESDFRSGRMAALLPREILKHMYSDNEKVNFANEDEMPYELLVQYQVPPECFVVTNIYHRLAVLQEMVNYGFLGEEGFSESIQRQIAAPYEKYGIDQKTGQKDLAS